MKTTLITTIVFFLFLVQSLTSFIPIREGNGWRGPERNGKIDNFILPEQWPGLLTQLWQTPVGLGDASPVFVEGKLYLHTLEGDSEVALCIDGTSGSILWKEINNPAPEITGGASSHPGPRSTPAVASGKVYNLGAGGHLTCRDANSGKLIWETSAYTSEVPQFFVGCSPLIEKGMVIVHLNGRENGTVVAFQGESGSEIWNLKGEATTYSSPVIMKAYDDMMVIQGETDLIGVSISKGNLLWKFPTPSATRFYNSSTPVVDGTVVYIAGQGTGIRAIRVLQENGTYRVEEIWHNPAVGVSFNTPVLRDGHLYGNEARFGSIFCVNALSGEISWSDTVKYNRFASMLDLGPVMVTLPATGQLIFFKPQPDTFNQVIGYKVAESEVYAHPVIEGRRIFVKDKEHLTCWKL